MIVAQSVSCVQKIHPSHVRRHLPSLGLYCCDNQHWSEATQEEKDLQVTLSSRKSEQELKGGTWRQVLEQGQWKNAAYWLTPHGLFNLLLYRTQDHQPKYGSPHNGLGPPQSITD